MLNIVINIIIRQNNLVYGNEMYSPESNICRSAVHNGAMDDSGGLITMSISKIKFIEGS